MVRKINEETKVDPIRSYVRLWIFRTQEIMDLWINEMQGQISDGHWENSRGTDWLWNNGQDIYMLGDKTKLILLGQTAYALCGYKQPKMNYPLGREIIYAVGDRAMEENGFSNLNQLKEAWRELNEAIKNPEINVTDLYEKFSKKPKLLAEAKHNQRVEDAFSYMENNLADIIKVNRGSTIHPYLSSRLQFINFRMDWAHEKVMVETYNNKGKFEAEVSPDKVRETVKFIQDVLWR